MPRQRASLEDDVRWFYGLLRGVSLDQGHPGGYESTVMFRAGGAGSSVHTAITWLFGTTRQPLVTCGVDVGPQKDPKDPEPVVRLVIFHGDPTRTTTGAAGYALDSNTTSVVRAVPAGQSCAHVEAEVIGVRMTTPGLTAPAPWVPGMGQT